MDFFDRTNEIKLLKSIREDARSAAQFTRIRGRIDLNALRNKADAFHRATGRYRDYNAEYCGLSLDDMLDVHPGFHAPSPEMTIEDLKRTTI